MKLKSSKELFYLNLLITAWDSDFFKGDFKEIDFTNFSSPYCTYTLTCLFKKECITNTDFSKFNYFKDNALYSLCLQKSRGAILNFYGAVYRLHPGGIYSSGSEYFQALSNFSSYSEILKQIPKSRVQNIIGKQKYWKGEFLIQLKNSRYLELKNI